jgi:hypothetical protein
LFDAKAELLTVQVFAPNCSSVTLMPAPTFAC